MPHIRVNEIEIYYQIDSNAAKGGEALLLIMGLGAQLIAWDEAFCRDLAAHGFTLIRFDNRDAGKSSKLHHLGTPTLASITGRQLMGWGPKPAYSLRDMAGDAFALLDALGIHSAHVVGASMGGMIGQIMAIERPERVRSLTSIMSHPGDWHSKIVHPKVLSKMLRPPPSAYDDEPHKHRDAMARRHLDFVRLVSGRGYPFEEERMRQLIQLAYDRGFSARGLMRQFAAIATAPNREPALRRLRVPTLVMHGTEDPLVPMIGGKKTARAVPGARLRLYRGMGHHVPQALRRDFVSEIVEHTRGARQNASDRRMRTTGG